MESASRFANRPALVVPTRSITYRELRKFALRIAATIQARSDTSARRLTAILAARSPAAFAGVLGGLLAGNGYVPLNPLFPPQRNQTMFTQSKCASLVVDNSGLAQLDTILEAAPSNLLVILPDSANGAGLSARWPQLQFADETALIDEQNWREPAPPSHDDLAYLLFTSGSTGRPKGVMVAQRNVRAFVDYITECYQVTELDRFSQLFDLTFDLSAFDTFVAWERGACVCCPSQKVVIKPDRFITDNELTVWFSTPSTAAFLKQLGALRPNRFPSLRLSLFCGEPLPVPLAQSWETAAPNCIIENLYGPTELTIACTRYRWDAAVSPPHAELGIVPIGFPYPGMNVMVADDQFREVAPGQEGELLMNGPQMSLGYLDNPENNQRAFVLPPGKTVPYYRTGDRVRRPVGDSPLVHLGRVDFQVKILGHRVELGEIEEVVRRATGYDGVVAVGWPPSQSGYSGVEVFIEGNTQDITALRDAAAASLPAYMVPRHFRFMERLPRNANNKLDRKALQELLETEA